MDGVFVGVVAGSCFDLANDEAVGACNALGVFERKDGVLGRDV